MVSAKVVVGNLILTALLAGYFYSAPLQQSIVDYQGVLGDPIESDVLRFIVIGDYGYQGLVGQQQVGKRMGEIVDSDSSIQFVLGTGDNFYNPDGVKGVSDQNWEIHWNQVYKNSGRLKDIPWYSTQGNHDYNTVDLSSQFQYRKNGWKFGSLYWSHSHIVRNKKVTFIHIDTSLLAYGPEGQGASKPMMKPWFDRLGFKDDQQSLDWTQNLIDLNEPTSDWMLAVGHHPVGGDCIEMRNTFKFNNLFKKNKITSYIHGHVHALGYSQSKETGISYFLSGAGGENLPPCQGGLPGTWKMGEVFGFLVLDINIKQETLNGTYHYISANSTQWNTHPTEILNKRQFN